MVKRRKDSRYRRTQSDKKKEEKDISCSPKRLKVTNWFLLIEKDTVRDLEMDGKETLDSTSLDTPSISKSL